jgi:dolichyl-phosphate-mannose-protein mannosyltransferase
MKPPALRIGLYALLVLAALALRLYHLGELKPPVFDEIFYPKFAYDYIQHKPFFDAQPPFSKYLLMLGMKAYHALPWVNEPPLGSLPFNEVNAVSYRWVSAVLGTLLVLVVARLVFVLTHSHAVALVAGTLVALDGSMIVASRFGLNNVQILFFGFLALMALASSLTGRFRRGNLLLGCVTLGIVFNIKWNGLAFWFIAVGGLLALLVLKLLPRFVTSAGTADRGLWQAFTDLKGRQKALILFLLLAVPAAVYAALWIPDLSLNKAYGFVDIHKQIYGFHKGSVAAEAHPYCSRWYTWPLMKRPISYAFETRQVAGEGTYYRDVHSFGNPPLYWLGALSMIALIAWLGRDLRRLFQHAETDGAFFFRVSMVGGYLACWLPWMFIKRCTFFYHYQCAAVFSFIAAAYVLVHLWQHNRWTRYLSLGLAGLLIIAFVYWLPLQLGIELDQGSWQQRMWFRSWI